MKLYAFEAACSVTFPEQVNINKNVLCGDLERKTTQFGSNNPFRNRASQIPPFSTASPFVPVSPTTPTAQRPVSRNPFLDVFGDDGLEPPSRTLHKSNSFDSSSTQRPNLTGAAVDLFVCNNILILPCS